ncbi:hypothetical protein ACN9MB_13550 [Dyella kyungheensis]|uniref:hypothetical protein n=1 Tax=Dyella kyungheensis TaxID=1242174 RepID=UPI003CF3C074
MEPLTRLTATNPFAQYLIPSVGGLDPHEGQLGERDLVIDADPNQSAGYEFRVAPHDTAFESPAIGLIFNNYFALQVVPAQHPNSLSGALLPCFTIITPKPGVFANQAIREDQAFIEHKQRVSGSRGMILFPPTSKNDRGTYRVVPSVPMRVQPKIDVDFFDPSLSAVQQVEGISVRRANVDIRFRVKGAGGFLNDPVAIKSITLDAEIY